MTQAGRNRAAALALLAGIVMVLAAIAIAPAARHWAALGASIRADRAKLAEHEAQIRSANALEGAEALWRSFAADPGAGFLAAPDDDAAREQAEALLRGAFVAHGGAAESVRSEALTTVRDGVSRIAVEATGAVARTELAAFLHALETGRPHVVVERLEADSDDANQERVVLRFNAALFRLDEEAL